MTSETNIYVLFLPSLHFIIMIFCLFYLSYYLLQAGVAESDPGVSLTSCTEVLILSRVFYFHSVSSGSRFDSNQILPFNILLFKHEIT